MLFSATMTHDVDRLAAYSLKASTPLSESRIRVAAYSLQASTIPHPSRLSESSVRVTIHSLEASTHPSHTSESPPSARQTRARQVEPANDESAQEKGCVCV